MSNPYYSATGAPISQGRGVSSLLRYEFTLIQSAFDAVYAQAFTSALPGQAGNAGKFIKTNGTSAAWSSLDWSDVLNKPTTLVASGGIVTAMFDAAAKSPFAGSADYASSAGSAAMQPVVSAATLAAGRAALGVAPRATRIDVASVAGTVDLTANAPNTDDIRITGALAITAFTVATDRVIRVTASGAFTLTNNANIVTQTGANIVAAAGDTFMLRATAANVVEVLDFTRALPTGADLVALSVTGAKIAAAAVTPDKLSGAQSGSAPVYGVRAWCVFNSSTVGTNAPIAGGNVTSVTRNGSGNYTVNFTTAVPGGYAVVVTCNSAVAIGNFQSRTTTSVGVLQYNTAGSGIDGGEISVFIIG